MTELKHANEAWKVAFISWRLLMLHVNKVFPENGKLKFKGQC